MTRIVMITLLCVLCAGAALVQAQPDPTQLPENHYLTYILAEPDTVQFPIPVELRDQFGMLNTSYVVREKLANPTDKNGEGYYDPLRHQTWWSLKDASPDGSVHQILVTHQFGQFNWSVYNPRYLVLPANKSDDPLNPPPPTPPPPGNHYLCYDAVGPPLDIGVTLVDQFGTWQPALVQPIVFCNPVEKTIAGNIYPIVDPDVHLACYELLPAGFAPYTIWMQDQFIPNPPFPNVTLDQCWFCLPSLKEVALPTEDSTWGRIKSLYKN